MLPAAVETFPGLGNTIRAREDDQTWLEAQEHQEHLREFGRESLEREKQMGKGFSRVRKHLPNVLGTLEINQKPLEMIPQ